MEALGVGIASAVHVCEVVPRGGLLHVDHGGVVWVHKGRLREALRHLGRGRENRWLLEALRLAHLRLT